MPSAFSKVTQLLVAVPRPELGFGLFQTDFLSTTTGDTLEGKGMLTWESSLGV